MDQDTLEDLIKVFQTLPDDEQEEVIRKLENRDKAAADLMKKVRRMQKRGEKIDNLTDKIEDKLS